MKIGALSTATGVPIDTIRHYEREGLLPEAARTEGNYRIYKAEHAQRLSFVRLRGLDMTLDEIRVLLHFKDAPLEDCGEVNTLLDQHIGHVAHRIRELRALEKQLRELRDTCRTAQDAKHCGILKQLDAFAKQPTTRQPGSGHVHGAHKATSQPLRRLTKPTSGAAARAATSRAPAAHVKLFAGVPVVSVQAHFAIGIKLKMGHAVDHLRAHRFPHTNTKLKPPGEHGSVALHDALAHHDAAIPPA